MDIIAEKKALREKMLAHRKELNKIQKRKYDEMICEKLYSLINEQNYQVIHAYLTMAAEINTLPLLSKLLSEGKTVVCPQTLTKRRLKNVLLKNVKEIEVGLYKTLQPKNPEEYIGDIDLVIVPGLAFDQSHYRLGYGGGYYDNFLVKFPSARKVGICYPFQKVAEVPKEQHDVQFDELMCFDELNLL